MRSPLQRKSNFPPQSVRSPIPSEASSILRALSISLVQRYIIPPFNQGRMVAQPPHGPWGNNSGPLRLAAPLHELPRTSHKNIHNFYGDGKQHLDENIFAFYIICRVLGMEHEDVFVRLFIETLQGVVADWFYNLATRTIKNWDTLQTKFEEIFKPIEDAHTFVDQLKTMRKEPHEPMHEFVVKFNKLRTRILADAQPKNHNFKCFFITT